MTVQTDRQTGTSMLEDEKQFIRNWIIYGMIAGLVGDLAFFLASVPIPLPIRLRYFIGFAFGPLLSLAFVGFYYFFKLHRRSVAMQATVLFGIMAGTLVNLMLVVQSVGVC